MQDFSELERLMDNVNKTLISEFDKKIIEKLGTEVKENSLNIQTYKDLVKFTKSIETLLWVSNNIQSKVTSGRGFYE
jgi:hypothetical protein